MRKSQIRLRLLVLLSTLLLLSTMIVYAVTPKVYDMAGLFTKAGIAELEKRAAAISEEYKLDVVIVTTNDNEGKTSREYADDFYDSKGFGYGENADGILLLIDMEAREAYISTSGKAIQYFTDERIESVLDVVISDLPAQNYDSAGGGFLNEVEYMLSEGIPDNQYTQDENGNVISGQENSPISNDTPKESGTVVSPTVSAREPVDLKDMIPAFMAISFIIAGIYTLASVKRHNYVAKTNEVSYLNNGSINLINVQDDLVDTRTTHRVIPKDPPPSRPSSSGSSGRSSVHTSSSGRTHGGGGRSFGASSGGGSSTHSSSSGRSHGGSGKKF